MAIFRGFIAIEINALPKIFEFEKDIKNIGADIKFVDLQQIHVTLKFLGDVDERYLDDIKNIMTKTIKNVPVFTINLQGTGVFPNQKYIKVVWIGIQQADAMKTMAYELNNSLSQIGFKKEKKEFTPHLTLGRVKTSKNKQQLLDVVKRYENTHFGTQQIQSISLKKSVLTSSGPIYTTLFQPSLS
ncbi:MAG: RNA 2',3'-cyclic phosphodiesterase [Thermoplasmatota archaeon]